MKAVVDASAFIMGPGFEGTDEIYISPLVEAEISTLPTFKAMKETCLRVRLPGPEALEKVRKGARETGDEARLSSADIEILALALDLGLPIVTDDYSIQNLASRLKVRYLTLSERGIRQEIAWKLRCTGCGKYLDERPRGDECPVCGSRVRTVRP
jgi:UPF0271 protein